ncbi:MAG: ribonuclease D [Proteobacteria bacterium]|nr:ribonuclease D [Pseudomonadota bacterium]MCH8081187.1 ribonuclease D [Pseudomonadota bacterium]MCH8322821.1 ribonuclease D [Pseudomonadota bacterium]
MAINFHEGDLPESVKLGKVIAVDTETMGLKPHRDRLCLVQLSAGDGDAHLVRLKKDAYQAPNLKKILGDPGILKIFHFARFDLAVIQKYLSVKATPVYCTKLASKLSRTSVDRHGLKDLCRDLLEVEISKTKQCSDWGAEIYDQAQLEYAASDVLYLHQLKAKLDKLLKREGRTHLAEAAFMFLPARAEMDLLGWEATDIFSHA